MIELERERVGMMSVSRPRSEQTRMAPTLTDTFWISVDSESDRRNSIGRKDSLAIKAKYDRDAKEAEKLWQLQRRVSDLNSQSAHLEKRVTALKEENEVLKRKMEDQKTNEDKTKQLKRRNAELASIARRLEEKLKQLQQDSPKKLISASPGLENSASKQTSQKTKLKERARSFNDKDKVIETMRGRFQELLRHHRSIQEDNLSNREFFSEQAELENVIKVTAKERLQLEKQLLDEQHNPEIEAQLSKTIHLEQRNLELTDEVEKLTKFALEREKLEIELMQRRIEVETLERQVTDADRKCVELAAELQDLIMKNTHLTVENTDMKRQIGDLDQMAKNYNSLNDALAVAKSESEKVKGEAKALKERVQTLEVEMQYLDQAEQKKRQLESEKRVLQEALQGKERDIEALRKEREYDRVQHDKEVKTLELRMAEIEGKYKEEVRINEAMSLEMEKLREVGKRNAAEASRSSVDIQADTDDLSFKSVVTSSSRHGDVQTSGGCGAETDELDNVFANGDMSHDVENGTSEILQVFQAMFDYDPEQCSPNEEPEAELLLAAGDYMFVCGDMDEDGFYFAELLDGRQGLVPSNFVRKLSEKELATFYSHINLDVEGVGADEGQSSFLDFCCDSSNPSGLSKRENSSRENSSPAVVELLDKSGDFNSKTQGIPDAPVNVQIESGPDHGCLMVSWLPVTITTAGTSNGSGVIGYNVYVDDHKVKYLPNPTGDHVLLESEDFSKISKPQCVTVRTVGTCKEESCDSLPAFIPPHLLHELIASSCHIQQDDATEFTENENLLVGKVLNSEDFEQEGIKGIENSDETTCDLRELRQQNLPEVASLGASLVLLSSRDDEGVVLNEANRHSVWRKVSPKSKLNTTFDASDLASADLGLNERTWKSLSSGEPKAVFVKTQSQEILGGSKRSEVRYSSHSDVRSGSDVSSKRWKSEHDEHERTERTLSSYLESVRTSSPSAEDRRLLEPISTSGASAKARSSQPKSASTAEHFDSAFSDLTSSTADRFLIRNGVSRDEIEEPSSCSELDDNDALTSKKIRDDVPDSELIDFSDDDGGESLAENVACAHDVPVRIFIALFSYDPTTMSPNPDAVTEELPFREGQIIKIYGEKDQDGFFLGEINHQRGLVPCNMISEVHVNDPEIAAQLLEETRRPVSQSAGSSRASSQTSDFTSRTHSTNSVMCLPDDERLSPLGEPNADSIPERYVIALYDYDPQELSPNTDVDEELSFRKGDVIKVLSEIDEDGFYYGQLNDHYGLIPSNFVKEAPSSAIYGAIALKSQFLQSR